MALTLGDRIINHMKDIGARIDACNIVILEDSDVNGKPVAFNSLDTWDDRILLVKNTGEVVVNSAGTCEPGYYYTHNPMNTRGAARIALGFQADIWCFGKHFNQDALVQCNPIKVHRDLNKDGYRTSDKVTVESGMGLNFHTTGNVAGNSPAKIGRHSAGCVVTQSSTTFYTAIMPLLRYSGRKVFSATIIDPALLWMDKDGRKAY